MIVYENSRLNIPFEETANELFIIEQFTYELIGIKKLLGIPEKYWAMFGKSA